MMEPPGFSPQEISSLVNRDVIAEHAQDAAVLWKLRNRATRAPHYRLHHLALLDARVLAHLEALRTAGPHGVHEARRALADANPGAVFALAYLAFSALDGEAMRRVVQLALADAKFIDALVAALAWLEFGQLAEPLRRLSQSPYAAHRRIALAVGTAHRASSLEPSTFAANDTDPALRARALRAIGELKRLDLMEELRMAERDSDARCRFWAAWSLAILGEPRAAQSAFEAAGEDPSLAAPAIEIAMRAGDADWARSLIRSLAGHEASMRLAVTAAGAFGDPAAIPWLLDLLEHPPLGRLAAEAFACITGVDPDQRELKQDRVDDGSDDHDDDNGLRWPCFEGFARWWRDERRRFMPGQRYLAGSVVSESAAINVLRNGYQRQRRGAAIELARIQQRSVLFPVFARADWQQRRLAV
jgi:uncharacterized protein (TIGR02270 family)